MSPSSWENDSTSSSSMVMAICRWLSLRSPNTTAGILKTFLLSFQIPCWLDLGHSFGVGVLVSKRERSVLITPKGVTDCTSCKCPSSVRRPKTTNYIIFEGLRTVMFTLRGDLRDRVKGCSTTSKSDSQGMPGSGSNNTGVLSSSGPQLILLITVTACPHGTVRLRLTLLSTPTFSIVAVCTKQTNAVTFSSATSFKAVYGGASVGFFVLHYFCYNSKWTDCKL